MQIPKVLNDRAVEAKIEGETTIQGEVYIALKVKFKQEGEELTIKMSTVIGYTKKIT